MREENEFHIDIYRFAKCLEDFGYEISWSESNGQRVQGNHQYQGPIQFVVLGNLLCVHGQRRIQNFSDDLSEGLFNVLNTLNGACKLARFSVRKDEDGSDTLRINSRASIPTALADQELKECYALWCQELAWCDRDIPDFLEKHCAQTVVHA